MPRESHKIREEPPLVQLHMILLGRKYHGRVGFDRVNVFHVDIQGLNCTAELAQTTSLALGVKTPAKAGPRLNAPLLW